MDTAESLKEKLQDNVSSIEDKIGLRDVRQMISFRNKGVKSQLNSLCI